MRDHPRVAMVALTISSMATVVHSKGAAAQDSPDVFGAGKALELVVSMAAQMTITSQLCGYGKAQTWSDVVDAIDKRYRYCVAQHAAWSDLARGWEKAAREAKERGESTTIGSLAFQTFLRTRGADARAQGVVKYCTAGPWQTSIEAGEAEAESQRINPNAKHDDKTIFGPAFVGWVINLGRDPAWVDAPCDKYFFPHSGR